MLLTRERTAHTRARTAFQHPPMHASAVAAPAGKPPHSCGSHIHDPIAKLKEELPLQRLREEVSLIVQCVDISDKAQQSRRFQHIRARRSAAARDVLRLLMVLRVVGNVPSASVRLVIGMQAYSCNSVRKPLR